MATTPSKTERLFNAWSLASYLFGHAQTLKTLYSEEEVEDALRKMYQSQPKVMRWLAGKIEEVTG
jgi:hypothetical protein